MEDLQMEHGFLKAPWEVLVRNFRAGHKPVVKELELVSTAVNQLIQQHKQASSSSMDVDSTTINSTSNSTIQQPAITALRNRLTGLKRKLEHTRQSDEHSIMKCQHRIAHLHARTNDGNPPSASLPSNSPTFHQLFDDTTNSNSTPSTMEGIQLANNNNNNNNNNTPSKRPSPDSIITSTAIPSTSQQEIQQEEGEEGEEGGGRGGKETDRQTSIAITNTQHVIDDTLSMQMSAIERQSRWERVRLDRALVDYMLREGMYDTAQLLAQSQGIEHIIDSEIFRDSRVVIQALRRRDCKEGLRWCAENKRRLQKVESKLEFRLRCQEFVELARARRKKDAIAYMRKYLSLSVSDSNDDSTDRFLDIQKFMALLIFDPTTNCQPYKDMYGEDKWDELEKAFKQDNYRLHGLTRESTLEILLKAGLASLKTRKCGLERAKRSNCPTCVEPYLTLSESLPRSRHENSILVCSISHEIMDENNPPMAMPKGSVYSFKALSKIADENDGVIIDPRTQDKARFEDLRKCFFM